MKDENPEASLISPIGTQRMEDKDRDKVLLSAAEKKAREKREEEIQKKEEKLQKALVKAAIKRQKANERFEIKLVGLHIIGSLNIVQILAAQDLAICFGDKIPKKRSEVVFIKFDGIAPCG